MKKYINAEELIRKIKEQWDMQELYLPVHFIDFVEEQEVAFDVEKVIEAIDKKSFDYYTPSGYAVDMGDVAEAIKRECGKTEETEDVCKWESDYKFIIDKYKRTTGCGYEFYDSRHAVPFKFCPYCRRKIKEVG